MLPDTQMYTFSNVHLKVYNQKNKRVLKEIHKKNTITKFALNGIASMIKGEFNDTNYNAINNYVPKYLALGTNNPLDSDESIPKTITESVSVNDTCLLSEITKGDRLVRIRLEDVKRESDTGDYIQIRFRTMVTSGTISYNALIQELGLFVNNTSLTSGLFARISTEPLTIPENSVLDVTWDVVIASSIGVMPTTVQILNANGEVISGDQEKPLVIDSYGAYGNVYPLTVNLESSVIDGVEIVNSKFDLTNVSDTTGRFEIWKTTNNFNKNTREVKFYNYHRVEENEKYIDNITYYKLNGSTYENANVTSEEYFETKKALGLYVYYYSISDTAPKNKENIDLDPSGILPNFESIAKTGKDASNNTIKGDNIIANAFKYKEVTYKNCTWAIAIKYEKLESDVNNDNNYREIDTYNEDIHTYYYKEDDEYNSITINSAAEFDTALAEYGTLYYWVGMVENTFYTIENYTAKNYTKGACAMYKNDVYICKVDNTGIGPFNPNMWVKIFTFIKYMTDCIIINYNVGSTRTIRLAATTYNKVTAYADIELSGDESDDDIKIVPVSDSSVQWYDGVLSVSEDVIQTNQVTGSVSIDIDAVNGNYSGGILYIEV